MNKLTGSLIFLGFVGLLLQNISSTSKSESNHLNLVRNKDVNLSGFSLTNDDPLRKTMPAKESQSSYPKPLIPTEKNLRENSDPSPSSPTELSLSSRMNFFVNAKIKDEKHREKVHQEIAALMAQEKMNILTEQDYKVFVNAVIKNLPHQLEMSYLKSYLVFQVKKIEEQHPQWSQHQAEALYQQLSVKQRSIIATLESAQF